MRTEIESFPKVSSFLLSMGRNSICSERAYLNGLVSFQYFLLQDNDLKSYSVESIIIPISVGEINIYRVLDSFVSFLISQKLSIPTIKLYVTAIRSYFAYHDIDIVTSKFKTKVKMPKAYREDEEALDVQDIRNILLACNNRRLKVYLLVLASGGFRAVEGLAIRIKDTDFSSNPTKIHVRKEFSKTKVSRDIYISDEATKNLKDWLNWKYKDKKSGPSLQNQTI